jgi:hypothetical protein
LSSSNTIIVYDIESYPNYFSLGYNVYKKGEVVEVINKFNSIISFISNVIDKKVHLVGYNSFGYDSIILNGIWENYKNGNIKNYENIVEYAQMITKEVIVEKKAPNKIMKEYGINRYVIDFDLMRIFPNPASLKEIGMQMSYPILDNLPFNPKLPLTLEQIKRLDEYLVHDVNITRWLLRDKFSEYEELLNLVRYAGMDDIMIYETKAKIATSFVHIKGVKNEFKESFRYKAPIDFNFQTPELQNLLKQIESKVRYYEDGKENYHSYKFDFFGVDVSFAEGGLHGAINGGYVSKRGAFDFDVSSMYPYLMLNYNLYPNSLDIHKFKGMVEDRIQLKKEGNPLANLYKIVINSVYGQMGYRWSPIFDWTIMLKLCITGQLLLLKLAEMICLEGGKIVYYNTDGLTVEDGSIDKDKLLSIISKWEMYSKLEMEETYYEECYIADVNNYIIVKDRDAELDKDKLKLKGRYTFEEFKKNRVHGRCIWESLSNFITTGEKVEDFITRKYNERDINYFTFYQKFNSQYKAILLDSWDSDDEGNIGSWNSKGREVDKAIRFVRVKDGNLLMKWKYQEKETYDSVDRGKSILEVENLETFTRWEDIDIKYYIQEAKDELMKVAHYYDTNPKLDIILERLVGDYAY